jgi:nonsense-mediated mRNA decay protein 3
MHIPVLTATVCTPGLLWVAFQFPEAIIVRKSYSEKRKKKKRNRAWKLKELNKIEDESSTKRDVEMAEADYERFLQDLEEDKELRSTINIFRDSAVAPESEAGDEDDLRVHLEEMLDEFDALEIMPDPDAGAGEIHRSEDEVTEIDERSTKRTRGVDEPAP